MTYDIDVIERYEQPAAVVRGHADQAHLAEFVGAAFREVASLVEREDLAVAGAPIGRYRRTGDGEFDIEAGFPVAGAAAPAGNIAIVALPGGLAARTLHVGPYEGLAAAYDAMAVWVYAHGYVPDGQPWEAYLDGPDVPDPRTEVYFPVRRA